MNKSEWLEEAKKARAILYAQWEKEGKPKKFYEWMVDQIDSRAYQQRQKESAGMDKEFHRRLEE